jgi:hypothetical protein
MIPDQCLSVFISGKGVAMRPSAQIRGKCFAFPHHPITRSRAITRFLFARQSSPTKQSASIFNERNSRTGEDKCQHKLSPLKRGPMIEAMALRPLKK